MKTLTFLLSTVIELYTMILLLRVWMQWTHCDFYNPLSQFLEKTTQPIMSTIGRFIPFIAPSIDSISLLIAFILCSIKATVLFMTVTFQPIIWIASMLILLKTTGLLIFWVLLIMVIISLVSQQHNSIEYTLTHLTDPLLRPIRNLLPSMGKIDFSPIIFVFFLHILNIGTAEILQFMNNTLLLKLWMKL